jgi:hypothetical protein
MGYQLALMLQFGPLIVALALAMGDVFRLHCWKATLWSGVFVFEMVG